MKFTGERIENNQWNFKKRFADHFVRYNFAKKLCEGKAVIDIACGTGYGTFELAQVAKSIVGVDVDKEAVEMAKSKYSNENLQYKLGNGKDIPMENDSVDTVISFETIEHIVDYKNFLAEIKRILVDGGTLLISTPNYLGEVFKNTYHVSNFTTIHFLDIVGEYFDIQDVYYQGKHFNPFPGRGILESIFGINRDVKIHEKKPNFDHHVTIIKATNKKEKAN